MPSPDPLAQFIDAYELMKAPHWREPAIDSHPRAAKRVLALARGFSPGGTWDQAITTYLAAYRLALRAASGMPLFGPRTTCWTVASPEAVRKLSGGLAITPADLLAWEQQVLWIRLPEPSLQSLRCLAANQGRSAPSLAVDLLEDALDRLPG